MTSVGPSIYREPLRRRSSVAPLPQPAAFRQPFTPGEKQIIAFVIGCFAFQLGLFVLGGTSLRLPLRIASYALSLFMLVSVQRTGYMHPAAKLVQYVVGILLIGFINPAGDRMVARLAQFCLYLAVMGPLLWASRRPMQMRAFRWMLITLWAFYTASAVIGVLQVHYPGRFDAALSSNYDDENMAGHTFSLANGEKYMRPCGLTDTPGGAAGGAVNSIVLGFGLLLTGRRSAIRWLAVGAMVPALYCIYLSQGRTNLIIVAVSAVALWAVLLRRGDFKRATMFAIIFGTVATVGTTMAFTLGGQAIVDRFFTSVEKDPNQMVYNERGRFLEQLVTQDALSDFVGAGQGRWGMMYFYFGKTQPLLWAEMMWQALLYDGGIPLIAIYMALLGALLGFAWKVARIALSEDLSCWAAVIFGFDIAAIAASFVFPIFSMQLGLEVFLINACLYATARLDPGVTPPRPAPRAAGASRAAIGRAAPPRAAQ